MKFITPFLLLSALLAGAASAELRSYKNFESLSDDESQDIAILPKEKQTVLEAPEQDYLPVSEFAKNALESCKQARAYLIFNQNTDDFVKSCEKALSLGAADAGYLLGSEFTKGEWLPIDLVRSALWLEDAAKLGSRLAKRHLVSYYSNPMSPFIDRRSAINIAVELESTKEEWDEFISASMKVSYGNQQEAEQGFETLVLLANKGYKRATIAAALAKIKEGALQDIVEARKLFEQAEIYADQSYSFLPVILDIADNKLADAREKLKICESLNVTCGDLYFSFLSKGIGGPKDLWLANDILERHYQKWPDIGANNYAWHKATSLAPPIYNPAAALKALKHIPEHKKTLPYVQDTMAAVYAANGRYKDAYSIQESVISKISGRGLGKRFRNAENRMYSYAEGKRWIEPLEVDYFISAIKGFESLSEIQLEVSSL